MSDTLLAEAQSAQQAGRLADAARLYHDLLRTEPRHFDALTALGMLYFHAGKFEQAQYLMAEAVKLDPLYLDGLCVRGVALVNLKRFPDALACFERALSMKPDYVDALSNHGTTLMEMGRTEEALAELERALAIDPTHAVSWNNRGNAFVRLDRFAEAVESYERALSIYPDFPDARQNRLYALGELHRDGPRFADVLCAQAAELMRQKRWDGALMHFDQAITVKPDSAEAHLGRGTVLIELKRAAEALESFDAALAIDPSNPIGWNNRGNALAGMKRFEEAVASYEKALDAQPGFQHAADNRDSALFELKGGTRCPPGYMRNLFDNFAPHYDDTMVEKLRYRAHMHLRALAERVLPRLSPPWRMLDLGCGTGLVGDAFKDLAPGGRLDGIDIAPRMLDAAKARGLYDELILGDLEQFLAEPGLSYDLILAADTMIYLGDLSATLFGVARRLEPGGFYLFAVESKDGEGWEQTPMNRFRHSESYLRDEAARAGLTVVDMMDCVLRQEALEAVKGFAVALRKPLLQ